MRARSSSAWFRRIASRIFCRAFRSVRPRTASNGLFARNIRSLTASRISSLDLKWW